MANEGGFWLAKLGWDLKVAGHMVKNFLDRKTADELMYTYLRIAHGDGEESVMWMSDNTGISPCHCPV